MLVPLIIQRVEATFNAVATPAAARVREPVEPLPANTITSGLAIVMMIDPAPRSLVKVSVVPIGYATDELAGIVHVRAVVSARG